MRSIWIQRRKYTPKFNLPNGKEIWAIWHRACHGVAFMYGVEPRPGTKLRSADAINLDGTQPQPGAAMVCGTCGKKMLPHDILDEMPGNPNLDPRYFQRNDDWAGDREEIFADEIEHAELFNGGQIRADSNIRTALADRAKRYTGRAMSIPGVKPRPAFDPLGVK